MNQLSIHMIYEVSKAALIQVLGAVADGELKAFEGARADAAAATDDEERRRAGRATRQMLANMLLSGRGSATPMLAFLRVGKPTKLIFELAVGHVRRMREIGLGPMGLPVPLLG